MYIYWTMCLFLYCDQTLKLTFQKSDVTLHTSRFNVQKNYVLPLTHRVHMCVLCGSENKQRLFHCTALTDWFL
jgi:hypothetical protein